MPERRVRTETWTEKWFYNLSREQKYACWYLKTNQHCNQAGVYHLPLEIMAAETKITIDDLPELLLSLKPHIRWYAEEDIIWVRDFIKEQGTWQNFLVAAAKCLEVISNNGLTKEVIEYNENSYGITIPFGKPSVRVSKGLGEGTTSTSTSNISYKSKGSGGVVGGDEHVAKVSSLFEENIGMITPMVAEKLKDIIDEYSPEWFEEAMKEAVTSGHRSLNYITAILERWRVEGYKSKTGGKHGADKGNSKKGDPSRKYRDGIGGPLR